MYVFDMVGTIILFIREMYGKKINFLGRELFNWSVGDANQLFILFGQIYKFYKIK